MLSYINIAEYIVFGLLSIYLLGKLYLFMIGDKLSNRLKITLSIWETPKDPNAYIKIPIDVENAIEYLEKLKTESGKKITLTHLIAKAFATTMAKPEFNKMNRTLIANTFISHPTVSISFLVAYQEGLNLGWHKVEEIDKKSIVEIATEVEENASTIRTQKMHVSSFSMLSFIPVFILKPLIRLMGILSAIGIHIPVLGIKKHPFGTAVISNVGKFDIEEVYAPRTPFSHLPFNVMICSIHYKPVWNGEKWEAKRYVNLCANFDHRYGDGMKLGFFLSDVKSYLLSPYKLYDGNSNTK